MRVLVADDETTTRLLVKAVVQKLGHECLVANEGDRAWALLQSTPIDVLITDWMMPGLDGPELCRRIRARPADNAYTYTILATVMSARADVLAGMQAGADDYLIKPLDPFDVQTRLVAAERVTALHTELAEVRIQLQRLNGELAQEARTDPLTQLGNRLRLREDLQILHARAQRHARPYSIAMCDLDNFKAYNDAYGHPQGDQALQHIAAILAADQRAGDTAYRYGGEEFVILYADEHLPGAVTAANRLRQTIENLAIAHTGNRPYGILTISLGVATYEPGHNQTAAAILELADQPLYSAKQRGRNQAATAHTANLTSTH
jgi:two-component system chemotaxis response regulator CheY